MKAKIRSASIAARRGLSVAQHAEYSVKIAKTLFESGIYKSSTHIMCYASYNCEVETDQICRQILADNKVLYLPRCEERGIMSAVEVSNLDNLKPGSYGINEPQGAAVCADTIELIIAPCVAFDRNMGRLGYGGGYYDRFFSKTKAKRCALAFGVQEAVRAAFDAYDMPMDIIITEREMIAGE